MVFPQHYSGDGTLGARDFSSAVSGFCQVFIVTKMCRPCETCDIAFMKMKVI